jgi:hypothetical protein
MSQSPNGGRLVYLPCTHRKRVLPSQALGGRPQAEGASMRFFKFGTSLLVVSMVMVFAPPALATSGSVTNHTGATQSSSGTQTYNDTSGSLNVFVSQASDDTSVCVDSMFDWTVSVQHYDGRIVRRCESSAGSLSNSTWTNAFTGNDPDGVHRAGVCVVTGTGSTGLAGVRSDCHGMDPYHVAPCGFGSAACYVKKAGTIRRVCFDHPASPDC